MEKVSIIVPIYNAADYLRECIESIQKQTYQNIEIILINDGSTDKSLEIAKEYNHNDERIMLKAISNSGVSVARNIGLELMSGKYVMFVDSDDWIERNTVEIALHNIKKHKSDIVIWSYFKNYYNKELRLDLIRGNSRTFTNEEEKQLLYLNSIYARYQQGNIEDVPIGTVMCKLYKSEFLKKNNIKFNPELIRSEDVVFAINAFRLAKNISYFNENLYHYRINESSVCNAYRYIEDTKTPFNLLIEELGEFQQKVHAKNAVQKAIDCRTIQALLWHLKYNYYHTDNSKGLLKRRKEIIELIKSEPYKTGLSNVNLSLMPKQEKIMVILFRKRLILLYYFIQKLISIKNKNKSSKYK